MFPDCRRNSFVILLLQTLIRAQCHPSGMYPGHECLQGTVQLNLSKDCILASNTDGRRCLGFAELVTLVASGHSTFYNWWLVAIVLSWRPIRLAPSATRTATKTVHWTVLDVSLNHTCSKTGLLQNDNFVVFRITNFIITIVVIQWSCILKSINKVKSVIFSCLLSTEHLTLTVFCVPGSC